MAVTVVTAILAAYASLLVELTVLRVPSVASSLNIMLREQTLVATYSHRYKRLFGFGKPLKLLLFVTPLLIVYAVFAYPLAGIWLGSDLLGDYLYMPTPLLDVAGIALMLLGRVIAIGSVLTIRRQNDQSGDSFYLHTSGLFRWSRNPGLVGMYLLVFGIWITMPSASMLAGIVVYVIYMDFKVRMEEDFLENKFGERFADYRMKTGRYVP